MSRKLIAAVWIRRQPGMASTFGPSRRCRDKGRGGDISGLMLSQSCFLWSTRPLSLCRTLSCWSSNCILHFSIFRPPTTHAFRCSRSQSTTLHRLLHLAARNSPRQVQRAITGLVTSLAARKSKSRRFPQPYIYLHNSLPAPRCTSIAHSSLTANPKRPLDHTSPTQKPHSRAAYVAFAY